MSIFKAIKNIFSAKQQSGTYMEFSLEMFEAKYGSFILSSVND